MRKLRCIFVFFPRPPLVSNTYFLSEAKYSSFLFLARQETILGYVGASRGRIFNR